MSASPPPQRPQGQSGAEAAPAYPVKAGPSRPLPGADVETHFEQQLSMADFFAQALDGAMALVHADGGEVATFDETRQVLVLRARRTRPRIDPTMGPMGAPGRHSQPRQGFPASASTAGPALSQPGRSLHPELASVDDEISPLDGIDVQSTLLLPATMISRTYRKGERLIGYTWLKAEPVIMSGDQCRSLPAGTSPADPDAPHHLAVPILRPSSLTMTRPNTDVIGVISVYNRDPLWSFTPRDVEQLTLHADRVARAMRVADLSREQQSQAELLSILASDVGTLGVQSLYLRLRELVRRGMDAPSFAILSYDQRQDAVTFELAERDGVAMPVTTFPAATLPPWWNIVRSGNTHLISAPEDRNARPEYCMLGWGGDQPAQSILAAPLMIGNTLLGALVVGSPRPDIYAPEHQRHFSTIARSAAILIQNTQLSHETHLSLRKARDKQAQLAMLNNAVLTLNASLDLDQTLKALVKQASMLVNVDRGVALLYDDAQGGQMVPRAMHVRGADPRPSSENVLIPADWRNLSATLQREPFAVFTDLDTEWNDNTPVGRFLREQRIISALLLPIERIERIERAGDPKLHGQPVHDDRPIGVLMVYLPDRRHHFTPEDVFILQGLVSQAAIAVSNAWLFEEQHKLNRELQEALEKQSLLDRLKDDFILTVSHEFRTPLTAIEGYVTLIGRHGHKLEQSKLDQFASEIRHATSQLMDMITRLHDAARVDEQPLQLSLQPVRLRAAAEAAITTQSPEDKARMMLQIGDDMLVMGDADRLKHIFANLLSNAVKYSPAESPCEITASVETVSALAARGCPHASAPGAPERWVVAGVRDRGLGITADDQEKLFHKFVRLSRSLTTSVRGTGLGLWICRQYVDAMGGDIWVESEFGKGAHFQFSLPLAPES